MLHLSPPKREENICTIQMMRKRKDREQSYISGVSLFWGGVLEPSPPTSWNEKGRIYMSTSLWVTHTTSTPGEVVAVVFGVFFPSRVFQFYTPFKRERGEEMQKRWKHKSPLKSYISGMSLFSSGVFGPSPPTPWNASPLRIPSCALISTTICTCAP